MTVIRRPNSIADASLGEFIWNVGEIATLKRLIIEKSLNFDADAEALAISLFNRQKTVVGNPTTGGCVFYERIKATISTNGGLIDESRIEYDLYDIEVETQDGKLYGYINNNMGATLPCAMILDYKTIK